MTGGARDRMVETAVVLLAKRGYQATSFSMVVEASKAPRGSIYHHFPDGKDQLVGAAVDLAGDRAIAVLESLRGLPAPEVIDGFMAIWRSVLARSEFSAGCSVLAVTVSAESPELIERVGRVFRGWTASLSDLLESGGMSVADARAFAVTVIAASEGAVVLSRAEQDFAPFDTVAGQLHAIAERSVADAADRP